MRVRRAWLLTALVVWPLRAADETVTPTELRPDAKLPDLALKVDLGERKFDLAEERRYGTEVVKFYSTEMRALQNPDLQRRVEAIAHRVITAAVLTGPKQVRLDKPAGPNDALTFTFRLLDTDEINAFSAWGGNLYVTRGMLEFCQSDDELAGIIAHEVAHSLYHHLREQVQKIQQYNTQQILALIAAAFMGVNVAHVAGIVQYVHLALLNGHSVENEAQADWAGCFYAYRAGYNPVGMITCFERLWRLYRNRPHAVELGAFQTHPWSDDRAASLEQQIRALGLPIDRRAVTNAMTAGVRSTPVEGGEPKVELLLGDAVLMQMAGGTTQATAEDRAADAALAVNKALNRGLRAAYVQMNRHDEVFVVRSNANLEAIPLFEIRQSDAIAAGLPLDQYAKKVYNRLVARCRQEEINRGAL